MEKNEFTEKKLQRQLDRAIAQGDTAAATELCAALFAFTGEENREMPGDFPARAMAAAEKGHFAMNKKKSIPRVVASVAAFALVLSFGITAYAQGWFTNAVSVLENNNAVVTGETINGETLDAALAAEAAKEEVYKKTVMHRSPDFITACEGLGLPTVYPAYLTEHPEFFKENNVETSENTELNTKGVYANYFADNGKSLSMSLAVQESADDVIAAYDDHMEVKNTGTLTTAAGDTYTLYDLAYTDGEGDTMTEANISINGYLFHMGFSGFDAAEIEAALNSADLTPLKN